jgi:hypothetical protein
MKEYKGEEGFTPTFFALYQWVKAARVFFA